MNKWQASSALVMLILLVSCGHMKSGRYVQLRRDFNLDDAARYFSVSKGAIKSANIGKALKSGSWVFVPLKRGIMNYRFMDSNYNFIDDGEFLWPVPKVKRISSFYGPRGRRHHDGIDIPAKTGTRIVAAADGVVSYSGNRISGYGNMTVIKHDNGYFTVYAHASKNYTRKNQRVSRGEVIALVGSTGRSTGPHLHFEIRRNDNPLDPGKFIPRVRKLASNKK